MIRVLTQQHYKKMPWKNGQGFTLELARSHGDRLDDFDWRVSIADVKEDGAFSYFHNKQRILGILEGNGLNLSIDQHEKISLNQKEFVAFYGGSDVYAELIDGVIKDFNLIYNPQNCAARLQWMDGAKDSTLYTAAKKILIFNMGKQLDIQVNESSNALHLYETLDISSQSGELLCLKLASAHVLDCCIIELFNA